MTVWAVSMVRDEADIIEHSVRHMADEVDHVLVADNLSSDDTRGILHKLMFELDNVSVVDDVEPGYYQSRKMTALAEAAVADGADWIVPFDADELWYAPGCRIRDLLNGINDRYNVLPVAIYDHRATALDPPGDVPFVTMRWRERDPLPLHKVAFRWQPGAIIEAGNHNVTLPKPGNDLWRALSLRHFPYRSAEQMVRKARNGAAAYAATDLPGDLGAHWRGYGRIIDASGPEALAEVFREHFWLPDPTVRLVEDPAPLLRWQ